jgi:hypothetical protein
MPSLIEDYGPLLDTLRFPNSGILAQGDEVCEAAKFHAPKPMVVRRVSLTPWSREPLETAWVCGICADSLAMYQQFLAHFNGNIPYDLANRFAPSLRRIAVRGWQLYRSRTT